MKLFYKIPKSNVNPSLKLARKILYISVEAVIMTMLVIKSFTVAYENDINLILRQLNELKASIGGFGINEALFWFMIKCSICTIVTFDICLYFQKKLKRNQKDL
ncbi:hypothetical protein ACDN41_15320 [Priestia aryabhattai]|uniref:hypothetical protein n=1 Tax=Priestia aryabhattai TaxID=412384 RepID=UPI003531EE12